MKRFTVIARYEDFDGGTIIYRWVRARNASLAEKAAERQFCEENEIDPVDAEFEHLYVLNGFIKPIRRDKRG